MDVRYDVTALGPPDAAGEPHGFGVTDTPSSGQMNAHVPDVGSRNIRTARPFQPVAEQAWAFWPCTRCGDEFRMHDSHLITFTSGARELGFVVCPACAVPYQTPPPVTIDLTRMPLPVRGEHPGIRQVAAHVGYVRRARARPPDGALQLRDSDLRSLALAADLTPVGLVALLQQRRGTLTRT